MITSGDIVKYTVFILIYLGLLVSVGCATKTITDVKTPERQVASTNLWYCQAKNPLFPQSWDGYGPTPVEAVRTVISGCGQYNDWKICLKSLVCKQSDSQ